ncbi:MAG: FtsX-like permease family protein, partial [Bifidobacteriaceae bacterium]|nr:FtsX-like permease family protein [Bifidobacteriaceae bacterium]
MFRIAIAHMRTHAGRLVAGLVAVAIATAFIVAAIVGVDAGMRTARASMVAEYAAADLVAAIDAPDWGAPAQPGEGSPDHVAAYPADLAVDAIAALAEVRTMKPLTELGATLSHGDRGASTTVVPYATEPSLISYPLTEGAAPVEDRDVILGRGLAERLRATVGNDVDLTWYGVPGAPDTSDVARMDLPPWMNHDPRASRTTAIVHVTGLFDDSVPSLAAATPGVQGASGVFAQPWDVIAGAPAREVAVVLADGVDPAQASDAIVRATENAFANYPYEQTPGRVTVTTPEERAAIRMAVFVGGQAFILSFLFVFAAISLAVAGLVIANTFQVLIAQRARTLALLRCVGASSAQIHRSVLIEGALTGLLGAIAGIAIGLGLVQGALTLASRLYPAVPVPATVAVAPVAIVLPLIAGIAVATLAALAPARRATATPPVAALRPLTAPTPRRPAGKARAIVSCIGIIGGAVMLTIALVISVVYGRDLDRTTTSSGWLFAGALGLGVLAALSLVVGIILAGPFWIPHVVRAFANLLGRTGPGARVAAANTVRNPRRTAATASALVIGVTLVAAVSAGSASIEQSLVAALSEDWAADFQIDQRWTYAIDSIPAGASDTAYAAGLAEGLPPVPEGAAAALATVDGVTDITSIHGALVATIDGSSDASAANVPVFDTVAYGVDPTQFAAISGNTDAVAALNAGHALVVNVVSGPVGLDVLNGDPVTVVGPLGSREFRTTRVDMPGSTAAIVIPLDALTTLVPSTSVSQVAAALAPGADAIAVADKAMGALAGFADADGNALTLYGTAIQRSQIAQVISVIVLVLMALLAVAVLIAVIGVANTLSLSVVERTREHGLLRALGL